MAGIFERAFIPSFQQSSANFSQQQDMKMREAMRQAEEKRQREQRLIEEAARVGVKPIAGADGSIDVVATLTAAERQKQLQEVLQAQARAKAAAETQNEVNTQFRGQQLGVQREQVPINAMFSKQPGAVTAPEGFGSFAKRVADAERQTKLSDYEKQREVATQIRNDTETATQKNAAKYATVRADLLEAAKNRGTPEGDARYNQLLSEYRVMSKGMSDVDAEVHSAVQGSIKQKIPTGEVKELNEQMRVASNLANMSASVRDAAMELGNGDPDAGMAILRQATGIGNNDLNNFLTRFVGDDAKRNKINNVIQGIRTVGSGYRHSQFGATLTGNELEAFKSEFGDPSRADFFDRVANFGDIKLQSLESLLENYEANGYNVLEGTRNRVKQLREKFTAPKTDAAPAAPAQDLAAAARAELEKRRNGNR